MRTPAHRLLLTAICILTAATSAIAQRKDSINVNIREYKDELGFYQKANRDLGDPRFMFYDETSKLNFGIGGTVKISSYYGFKGSTIGNGFTPQSIIIPHADARRFVHQVSGSELHAKARSTWRGHGIIAFIKMSGSDENTVKLSQAYVSFDGLSFGLIPSFFMDLEVGAMTTGIAPDTQIDFATPLFGYTAKLSEHFSAGFAFEKSDVDIGNFVPERYGVDSTYQPLPDLTGRVKFRWNSGHLQFGFALRNLTYWALPATDAFYDEGETRHCLGYGLSLSGNINPNPRLKFSGQAVAGEGIATYIPGLADCNLVLGWCQEKKDGMAMMTSIPVSAGMLSVEYKWSERFSSSLVFATSRCYKKEAVVNYEQFKKSYAATANIFWSMKDYAYIGLEYLYGYKENFPLLGVLERRTNAQRIAFTVACLF